MEVAHKRKNLKVAPDGDFGVELQVYLHKEGRHPEDVYDRAAMMKSNTSDILAIENRGGESFVTCQSTEPDTLTIFDSITGRITAVQIDSAGVHTIAVK